MKSESFLGTISFRPDESSCFSPRRLSRETMLVSVAISGIKSREENRDSDRAIRTIESSALSQSNVGRAQTERRVYRLIISTETARQSRRLPPRDALKTRVCERGVVNGFLSSGEVGNLLSCTRELANISGSTSIGFSHCETRRRKPNGFILIER